MVRARRIAVTVLVLLGSLLPAGAAIAKPKGSTTREAHCQPGDTLKVKKGNVVRTYECRNGRWVQTGERQEADEIDSWGDR